MATALSPQDMVNAFEAALQTMAPGVTQVTVDGTGVTYNRDQLIKELEYWRKRAAKAAGRKSVINQVRLG